MLVRLSLALLLIGCKSNSGAEPDAATTDGSIATDSSSDTALPPDPWTQALGEPVPGVTLAGGWTDLRLLPAPMAIDGGWTDSLFATPDGLHLHFAYAPMDFSDFFISNGANVQVTGPQLLGNTGNSFKLYDAVLDSAGWTIAKNPVESADPNIVEASPATNVSGDLYVFTRYTGGTQAQLYYSSLANAAWSVPVAVPINSLHCNDDNAKIVGELATSVTIYFESNRSDGAGQSATCSQQRTLWMTTYSSSTDSFSTVTKVPGIATTTSDDSQPFVTADQQTIYWSSVRGSQFGIFEGTLSGGVYGNFQEIVAPTTVAPFAGNLSLVGEASIVVRPQGQLLYLMCGIAYDEHGGKTFHDADTIDLRPCVARKPN